jgi:hypothetical protein
MNESRGSGSGSGSGSGVGGIGSIADKRRAMEWLKYSDKKYRKPLQTGEMNVTNILGGSWNEYAQVVFSMMILDTLVNIEEQLRIQNGTAELAVEVQVLDANKSVIGVGRRHAQSSSGETVVLIDRSLFKHAAYAREMDGRSISEEVVFKRKG